jgi:hypothetical protein
MEGWDPTNDASSTEFAHQASTPLVSSICCSLSSPEKSPWILRNCASAATTISFAFVVTGPKIAIAPLPMNCQKAMTLPLKEEEASRLDPKVKVKAMQVVQQTSTLMAFLA